MKLKSLIPTLSTSTLSELKSRPSIFRIPKIHDELISDTDIKYLVIKGGRGGFKTTSFICAMIEESYRYSGCAFLFTREIARSIEDSVYSVVKDLVEGMGEGVCHLCTDNPSGFKYSSSDFTVGKRSITNNKTGVRFLFTGLRSTGGASAMSQINKVKGYHKVRIIMMEEGQDLSEDSLNVLFPTVNRKGGAALTRHTKGHSNYVSEPPLGGEGFEGARFFVAMNPNKEIDPIVSKVNTFVDSGTAVIAHINMQDISGKLGDTSPTDTTITINGYPEIVQTEPDLQDAQLLNQMSLEAGEYYFSHVWEGAAFHKFAGLPWSTHTYAEHSEVEVVAMFLDPSFKGGDYTSLACLGKDKYGRVIVFGRAWKSAWNMEPALSGIVEMYNTFSPDKFWYEDNSLGTVPRTLLGDHGINAFGVTSILNKEDRIYKAAAFTRDLVSIDTALSDTTWLKMVKEYSDEAEYDDPPDSLASVIIQTGIIKEKLKW